VTARSAKLTFPARKAQASRLWRIADAIYQGAVLRILPFCAKLHPNQPVIRWMSDDSRTHQTGSKVFSGLWESKTVFKNFFMISA
jgi:hypothetical protein